jgi:hypothetical protein
MAKNIFFSAMCNQIESLMLLFERLCKIRTKNVRKTREAFYKRRKSLQLKRREQQQQRQENNEIRYKKQTVSKAKERTKDTLVQTVNTMSLQSSSFSRNVLLGSKQQIHSGSNNSADPV